VGGIGNGFDERVEVLEAARNDGQRRRAATPVGPGVGIDDGDGITEIRRRQRRHADVGLDVGRGIAFVVFSWKERE
jgi:hypothetical protein